jgi:glycosyltransferase involved in cell wall biosynthesis
MSAGGFGFQFGALRVRGPMSVWAAVAVAILIFGLLVVSRRRYNSLSRVSALQGTPARPDCMAIIPARNEEAVIARAVRSLPPDTVIVVDDHSEDGTAEAARQAGAGVLPAPPLPRNGMGKANACAAGAWALTSRWILFTDADTWFEAGFLPAVVATAESSGVSLLSIYLQPECETFAERVLVPYARALFFCGTSPKRNPDTFFSGQCLLVRREPYMFLGTHGAVVSQLVEDVKLTFLAQRHRLRYEVVRATDLGHARMYNGFSGVWTGIERHAFRFMIVSPWIGITILLAALAVALWLPALIWLTADREFVAAAVFAFLPAVLLRSWYGSWPRSLLAPLAIYGILPILARGFLSALAGKPVAWKGRIVRAVS